MAFMVIPAARDASSGEWRGMVLAFASAWIAALEVILIEKIAATIPAETVNLYRFGTAAVLVAPFAFSSHWSVTGRDGALY